MIAAELLAATLFSSVVGSLHCVGMCTPFAILAMGSPDGLKRDRMLRISSYHLGRLATYLLMGLGVALLSSAVGLFLIGPRTSQWVGWGVGVLLIIMGILRMQSGSALRVPVKHSAWLQQWSSAIVRLRRSYAGGPVWLSSFLWGLTSTLLPCGWLYLFVLAAAAAPNGAMTLAMMVAFWIGTLPLLSVAAWGWSSISLRWQSIAQPFAACCIISFGAFILVHRSLLDLSSMKERSTAAQMINVRSPSEISLELVRRALDEDLPCCRVDDVIHP